VENFRRSSTNCNFVVGTVRFCFGLNLNVFLPLGIERLSGDLYLLDYCPRCRVLGRWQLSRRLLPMVRSGNGNGNPELSKEVGGIGIGISLL